jgi:hypothetical protein
MRSNLHQQAALSQVGRHGPTSRDIILNLELATDTETTRDLFERAAAQVEKSAEYRNFRGEQNVEEKYLKTAWWKSIGPFPGYFVTYNNNDYAVEFYRNIFCWVAITWDRQRSAWEINGAAPTEWGLDIPLTDTPLIETHTQHSPSFPLPSDTSSISYAFPIHRFRCCCH